MEGQLSERQRRAIENQEKAREVGGRIHQTVRSLKKTDTEGALKTRKFGLNRGDARTELKKLVREL